MRRIKQGHTRWRMDVICGHGGHADMVYVYQCIAERVTWCAVHYFDGHDRRITSHHGWSQMYTTYRKAWRAAWRMVQKTDNIRGANKSQNAQNAKAAWSHNKASGLLGVYWSEQNGKWGAKVNLDGHQYHAGFHETPEEAHAAYVAKKRQLHEFCTI